MAEATMMFLDCSGTCKRVTRVMLGLCGVLQSLRVGWEATALAPSAAFAAALPTTRS